MAIIASLIFFVTCQGGPAAHFSTFAHALMEQGHQVELLATGAALSTFHEHNLSASEFNPEQLAMDDPLLAEQIALRCQGADLVITDVGHPLMAALHRRLSSTNHYAYYDNFEPYVPGEYSRSAAEVMPVADKVLFANAKFVEEPLYNDNKQIILIPREKRVAIGFYPFSVAEKIKRQRELHKGAMRAKFFGLEGIEDHNEQLLVYFGRKEESYFIAHLDLPKEYLLLIQKHPGDTTKSFESRQRIYFSQMSRDEALILADCALYCQTSMGPQFIVAAIPTIQIGEEAVDDVLVKNNLCPSVRTREELLEALQNQQQIACDPRELFNELAMTCVDWKERIKKLVEI